MKMSSFNLRGLWFKYGGGSSVKACVNGIEDISDLTIVVKKMLSPALDAVPVHVSILLPGSKDILDPGVLLADLPNYSSFYPHDSTNPLIVKTPMKTIYVQDMDEYLCPLETFSKLIVMSDKDVALKAACKGASALKRIGGNHTTVSSFAELIDGAFYRIYSPYYLAHSRQALWQQKEDKAMEVEVGLVVKDFLIQELGSETNVHELHSVLVGVNGEDVQEWDCVFRAEDRLYLCECKHAMNASKIQELSERIQGFRHLVETEAKDKTILEGINVIVGVAAGSYFPEDARKKAKEEKLLCVRPSGLRYFVEGGGPL